MNVVKYFHMHRFADASWLIMFVLALFFLYKNSSSDKTRRALFVFIMINVLIVYCPITARILVPAVFPGGNEYERLSWTFFIIPVIAYALSYMVFSARSKGKKWIWLPVALVLYFATDRFGGAMFKMPENIYKIPDEAIELVEILDKDVETRGLLQTSKSDHNAGDHGDATLKWMGSMSDNTPRIGVAMQMSPLEVISDDMSYNAEVYYGIRQYASRYPLEMLDVNYDKAAERLDWTILDITKIDSDYLILESNEIFDEVVPMIGFFEIDETENFVLYRKYNAQ